MKMYNVQADQVFPHSVLFTFDFFIKLLLTIILNFSLVSISPIINFKLVDLTEKFCVFVSFQV